MEFSDWVNVVAITADQQAILIKQYRHATEEICLEIPGGSLNPGSNESPEAAARRELIEETGYEPKEVKLLGYHNPNPALQNNKMWTFLATGCEKVKEQELDAYEDIEVLTVPKGEVLKLVKDGSIKHSLIIASLFWRQKNLRNKARDPWNMHFRLRVFLRMNRRHKNNFNMGNFLKRDGYL